MSELLGIPVTTHGLWHAGSYDPQDFLGRLVGDKPWVRYAEKSFFQAFDHNYFATDFHIKMFMKNLFGKTAMPGADFDGKVVRTGWPMEYMLETLLPYQHKPKRDLILFPHRIAPEKQLEIFKGLAQAMPEYEWVICQEQNLTKQEYHKLLAESKMVFSANLQETLGISIMEGMLVGAWPMVPDRLSYSEMYPAIYKYDPAWTSSFDSYKLNRENVINYIRHVMNHHIPTNIILDSKPIFQKYFMSFNLLRNLNRKPVQVDSANTDMLNSENKE